MADIKSRPLSPHLTIWRWGPHMVVSILHRVTGAALSFAGLAILTWWLAAIAGGSDDYATFTRAVSHPLGLIVLIGLTWSFFQHLLSGIRHLAWTPAPPSNSASTRRFAVLTIVGSLVLTALFWIYFLGVRA